MLGKIEGRGEGGDRGWDRLTNSMDMSLNKLREIVKDRAAWCAAVLGVAKGQTQLRDWTTTALIFITALFGRHFHPWFLHGGKWSLEKLSNLLEVTRLVSGRTRIQTWNVWVLRTSGPSWGCLWEWKEALLMITPRWQMQTRTIIGKPRGKFTLCVLLFQMSFLGDLQLCEKGTDIIASRNPV